MGRLIAAILTITAGLTFSPLSNAQQIRRTPSGVVVIDLRKPEVEEDVVLVSAAQISFERIYDGCEDCPNNKKIVLRRDRDKKFENASVIQTDLRSKQERRGMLHAYFFNQLIKLIDGQKFFEMNDEYAMGWFDAVIATMTVSLGAKQKTIRTRNEGEVPVQLWGIYYAIDGTMAHVKWETSQ